MKLFKTVLGIFVLFSMVNCASGKVSNIQSAQFALDSGDYDKAIEDATDALATDPNSVEAGRILGSAYFARSGLNFLDIASGIVDLQNSTDTNLQQIADIVPDDATMADLRSAIEALEAIPGITDATITDDTVKDAAFDLGIMEIIEHFAVGVYSSNFKTSFDVTGITDDDATNVQTDLINFDNRLISSGVESTESFIGEVRQTFCILEPISAGDGFTTAEYQAFVGCQLSTDPSTFDTATLTADIPTCDTINPDSQGALVEACYDEDTSL